MKKIDQAGLLMCDLQAEAFELSLTEISCSTEIFIRRFMHSETAKRADSGYYLNLATTPRDIVEEVVAEYGESAYGKVKYTANELYWIGFIYRYFAYTYEISSLRAYKLVKPKELRTFYPACHTMDGAQAIERILEIKKINLDMSIERQYEVFKRMRKAAEQYE